MKSLKSSVLAVVLLASIGGAFAFKPAGSSKRSVTWTHYNRAGNPIGTFQGTVDEAKAEFGCNSSAELCADSPDSPEVLRYSPL